MKHTISDLYQMQAMPLSIKIRMTQTRIKAWVEIYGEDGVYISFSGGKDSTVLLDIARKMYTDLLAVFVDTGLEYPEIRDFVKTFDNVEWLKPKKNFKQVITEHGYPFISKEISHKVHGARRYVRSLREGERVVYACDMADLLEIDRRENPSNPTYRKLKTGSIPELKGKTWWERVKGIAQNPKDKGKSRYSCSKYAFFLDAPFEISDYCCSAMKKSTCKEFY